MNSSPKARPAISWQWGAASLLCLIPALVTGCAKQSAETVPAASPMVAATPKQSVASGTVAPSQGIPADSKIPAAVRANIEKQMRQ